jgi:hypothetical protein
LDLLELIAVSMRSHHPPIQTQLLVVGGKGGE